MAKRSSRRAFTLIEVLTAIAIVVALASILVPALVSAKARGKRAAEIGQLRQLGLAASLYAETYEARPLSVLDFRNTKEWESPLWSSGLDSYQEGVRNKFLESVAKYEGAYLDRVVPFKVSYIGIDDVFPFKQVQLRF